MPGRFEQRFLSCRRPARHIGPNIENRESASLAVNREVVLLYWQIGRDILERQRWGSRGAKVIDRLAADLKCAIPVPVRKSAPSPPRKPAANFDRT
jgi:DUF1016 N-terminal domain